MELFDIALKDIDGSETSLSPYRGKAMLIVNVASRCGLTPQYEGLERLQKRYEEKGFTVLGFPCNQFKGQEPGSADEIKEFCSTTYGVTFPLFEKLEVNGEGQHPLYRTLTQIPDEEGAAGDIQWNFEKFLVAADGSSIRRFRPPVEPEDPKVIAAIEESLPTTDR